jgi:hypothetical protein
VAPPTKLVFGMTTKALSLSFMDLLEGDMMVLRGDQVQTSRGVLGITMNGHNVNM